MKYKLFNLFYMLMIVNGVEGSQQSPFMITFNEQGILTQSQPTSFTPPPEQKGNHLPPAGSHCSPPPTFSFSGQPKSQNFMPRGLPGSPPPFAVHSATPYPKTKMNIAEDNNSPPFISIKSATPIPFQGSILAEDNSSAVSSKNLETLGLMSYLESLVDISPMVRKLSDENLQTLYEDLKFMQHIVKEEMSRRKAVTEQKQVEE